MEVVVAEIGNNNNQRSSSLEMRKGLQDFLNIPSDELFAKQAKYG